MYGWLQWSEHTSNDMLNYLPILLAKAHIWFSLIISCSAKFNLSHYNSRPGYCPRAAITSQLCCDFVSGSENTMNSISLCVLDTKATLHSPTAPAHWTNYRLLWLHQCPSTPGLAANFRVSQIRKSCGHNPALTKRFSVDTALSESPS